ncbi:class II aldolase/adducin family protein [Pseudomonas fuscovaginae UPB0736]|uniref:L-fuculose-phosphate aldolase n=1 Tax=Pseudomonas asplenii TaxID=53407 RepID=A0A1H6P6X6_9PSED|nr:class II aldolase/adducin family protein [Pseudomonas fuscovaginae]UUQ64482.1 class II aldolase/adducin family protein [Pseudomonas fuscovaginae UPB0736]SEI21890.1 L-fuculose-phosphate aldolase [Pseudomonas fuscovaginae]
MSLFQQQVVELSRHLSRLGFFAATGGNLALRIDAEFMAVTPSAVDYHSMQAKDVCIVRLRDLHKVAGEGTPSVESSLHARVLRRRADVQCTIHTHQPLASACTLFGEALVVDRAPTRQLLGARIPIVGYAPSGSRWLASKLERAIRPDLNGYLMRNHGVLCCGPDIETTLERLEGLEDFCRQYLLDHIHARLQEQPGLRSASLPLIEALLESSSSVPSFNRP